MSRLRTAVWATWTTGLASILYVTGRISEDEWRTRAGIARVAVGRDEIDIREARGQR